MSLKTYKPKPKYLKLVLKKLKLNHLLLVETHVYSTGFTVPDSKHVLLSQAGRQAGRHKGTESSGACCPELLGLDC